MNLWVRKTGENASLTTLDVNKCGEHNLSYPITITNNAIASQRVCFIRHDNYPHDKRSCKQVEALVEAGYVVDVLCLKESGQTFFEMIDKVRVYRIPIRHRRTGIGRYFWEYGLSFLLFSILLTLLHIRRRYRCIHVATMPDFLVFTSIIPKLLGAKVLLDLHEPTPELWQTKYGDRFRVLLHMQTWFEQAAINFTDATVTVTEELRERVIERGARREKIFIVSNVCDERIFSENNQQQPTTTASEGFNLITHGLIEKRYGHEEIIRAVVKLHNVIPNLHLQILGAGEYKSRLLELVEELDCRDIVEFAGYVPHDELMRCLQSADAGVIAMRRSPYSELIDTNKMYEYIALRKPVIITRLKPVARQFNESCVKLFEPGDVEDLARCILELYLDPQRGRELAENAYKRFEQLCWGHEKKKYVQVVHDLVIHGQVIERPNERTEPQTSPLPVDITSTSYESDEPVKNLEPVQQTTNK